MTGGPRVVMTVCMWRNVHQKGTASSYDLCPPVPRRPPVESGARELRRST